MDGGSGPGDVYEFDVVLSSVQIGVAVPDQIDAVYSFKVPVTDDFLHSGKSR